MRKKYKVFFALAGDILAPYIWVSDLQDKLRGEIVKITNHGNDKSVVCQVLLADENYKKRYDQSPLTKNISNMKDPFVVMNRWYREDRLRITNVDDANLEIKPICQWRWLELIRASFSHPDYSIRLAVYLAILSVILGFAGFIR